MLSWGVTFTLGSECLTFWVVLSTRACVLLAMLSRTGPHHYLTLVVFFFHCLLNLLLNFLCFLYMWKMLLLINENTHACTHTHAQARARTRTSTRTSTRTHTRTSARTHTHKHAHTHAQARAHTHTLHVDLVLALPHQKEEGLYRRNAYHKVLLHIGVVILKDVLLFILYVLSF